MTPPARASLRLGALALALAGCEADPGAEDTDASSTGATETEAEAEAGTEAETETETGAEDPSLGEVFEAAGFTVSPGHVSSFLVEDCEPLDDCFGNNASAPYLLFALPSYPGRPETLPDSEIGAIPKIPPDMSPAYYLETNEAVVIVGQTPPTAKYFGLTPYLFQRSDAGGARVDVFASLGDSLNQVNAHTAAGGPFDATIAVVASADASTMAGARAALEAAGVEAEAINEMVLPPELLRLGLDPDDDTALILGRLALFEDPAAGDAYLADVPLEVFRLTPETSGAPLPTPARTPRGDGTNEDALLASLDALEAAIEASLAGQTHEPVPIASAAVIATVIDPDYCIANTTECLGDNADTTYAAGPLDVVLGEASLTLGPNDAFVVFGVNHEAAGKATYSGVSVYTKQKRVGVAAVDSLELAGSASAYLPDDPNVDSLWAWEIRRDCGARANCLTLSTQFPGAALDESVFFIFRAYVQPGLSVSPGHDELLTERVVVVRG